MGAIDPTVGYAAGVGGSDHSIAAFRGKGLTCSPNPNVAARQITGTPVIASTRDGRASLRAVPPEMTPIFVQSGLLAILLILNDDGDPVGKLPAKIFFSHHFSHKRFH